MATVAELLVRIGGDSSGLRREISNSQRQLRRAFGNDALELSSGAATLLGGLATAMGLAGAAAVKMSSDMQANKTSFTTLLGSAEAAEKMMKDLASFAADTPFELPGLVMAAKKLMAFQFAAEDIIPIMSAVGDAIALVGGGQEAIDGVIRALGQIQAKGKLSAEEMNQLSERGINGWKYIADEMGISVADVMDLCKEGSIDATTAINAVVKGMQTNFKGGMEALAKEIPGLLSTIKDNAAAVAREIGDKIIEELDLKNRLQGVADDLGNFAAIVEQSGIKAAILTMVPPEATAAVFALGGAVIAVAVPALYSFALAAIAAQAPLIPLIALGTALGVVAYEIWKNWEPLGALFEALMSGISATCDVYWGAIKTTFYTGVQAVLQTLSPLINLIGGELQQSASRWLDELPGKIADSTAQASSGVAKLADSVQAVKTAASGIQIGMIAKAAGDIVAGGVEKPNRNFTGLHGAGSQGSSKADDKAAKEAEKEWEKLEKKAQQVSDAIEKEWVQTTKTQLEQLDIWKAEEYKSLDETAAANENYERDKLRVDAVYSTRRTKILQQEAKDASDTFRSIRDGYENIQSSMSTAVGSAKDTEDLNKKYADKIKMAQDYFDGLSQKYETATDAQKQTIINGLNEAGVAYQVAADGHLNLEKATADAITAYKKQKLTEETNYLATCKDVQADIDAAYAANSMAMLQQSLTEQNAVRMNDYTAQKSMMDTWQAAFLAAHATTAQLVSQLYDAGLSGLTTTLSNIFTMTQSVGEAFTQLGKTLWKVIADYFAKMIAGQVVASLIGEQGATAATSTAAVAGPAVATAWAPAAAMVSLATFGANSTPAMLGIAATTGLATLLASAGIGGKATGGTISGAGTGTSDSILSWLSNGEYVIKASAVKSLGIDALDVLNTGKMPAFATGGFVGGPSLATLSGRYSGATLSGRMFKQDGQVNSQTATISQTINGGINTKVDYDEIMSDLGDAVAASMRGA